MSKLNVGVCTGLAVATAGLFVHNVLYWGGEAGRGLSIAWAYLGVWGLAILYAFVRDGVYKANRELVALTGGLLVIAAICNQLLTELPMGGVGGHTATLLVDLTLIVFGGALLVVAKALPSQRSLTTRAMKNEQKTVSEDTMVQAAE